MKSKTKTYLLLSAVLGIWGAIGYQIVTGIHPEPPETKVSTMDLSFSTKKTVTRDTFSIKAVDRDPFLGTLQKKKKPSQIKKTIKLSSKDSSWIPISYQGLVKRSNASQKVFVVTINKQQYLLKQGQTVKGVTLTKGTDKNIVVRYKNEQKTITIQ